MSADDELTDEEYDAFLDLLDADELRREERRLRRQIEHSRAVAENEALFIGRLRENRRLLDQSQGDIAGHTWEAWLAYISHRAIAYRDHAYRRAELDALWEAA